MGSMLAFLQKKLQEKIISQSLIVIGASFLAFWNEWMDFNHLYLKLKIKTVCIPTNKTDS